MVEQRWQATFKSALRLLGAGAILAPVLAGCGLFDGASISSAVKFTESAFGVAASPRVTSSRYVKKGGGRYMVGKPYKVAGKWYRPRNDPGYEATGTASWYGPNFHGRLTANGEVFDQNALTAAHPTLPLPSYVRVTNLSNNRSVIVRVNDRGPYAHGRVIDLSRRAADMLGYLRSGTARVRVQYVGRAPLEGDDTRILMASYNAPSPLERNKTTLLAFNSSAPLPSFDQQAPVPAAAPARGPTPVSTSNGSFPADKPISLLSYTGKNGDAIINSAFSAATALANQPTPLSAWQDSMDEQRRAIDLKLGVFSVPERAKDIALAFSVLAAVEQDPVQINNSAATLVRLTYLKPGVQRADVLALARQYGLGDVAFTK